MKTKFTVITEIEIEHGKDYDDADLFEIARSCVQFSEIRGGIVNKGTHNTIYTSQTFNKGLK